MYKALTSQSKSATTGHLLFFDPVRNIAMLSVIIYHAAGAYSTMAPWWSVHDGTSTPADFVRQIFDVYMMPVFFFIAGFFALSSLRKKGLGSFITDKLKRLGAPWLLVMLTIVPLLIYAGQLKNPASTMVHGFWNYFISGYLGGFGTIRLGFVPPGQITQMHFWYISLLITFFIVFGLIYQVIRSVHGMSPAALSAATTEQTTKPACTASILRGILLFSLLSTVVSFIPMLRFPDMSWFTIDLLWQFQPTKVGIYALIFGLGIYAYHRQWFANKAFFNRPGLWTLISILLATGYLYGGREVFAHTKDSELLSPAVLLIFSTIRAFLCPAILITLLSIAYKFMNRPLTINQKFAPNSFNIYLVHFFFVIILQEILMIWRGGPIFAKIGIIFLITLPVSYGLSRLIKRFPRGFSVVLTGLFILVGLAMR